MHVEVEPRTNQGKRKRDRAPGEVPQTLDLVLVEHAEDLLYVEVDEGSGIMEELDSGQAKIMEIGVVAESCSTIRELDSGQTIIMETGEVDEDSGIMEELDSGQTKIMETGADDDGSDIKEELDNGKTNIMETGVFPEEIPRSTTEISRFEPITSEQLKNLLECFKVEFPESPDSYRESFVRQIIQGGMLRKLVTAVQSLSKGIVLTENISTKRHDLPTVEACVLKIDVVYDGDQFCASRTV